MKTLFLVASLLTVSFCFSQDIPKPKKNYEYQDTRKKNESFAKLPPDIKTEISTFTFLGIDVGIKKDPLQKVSFNTIGPDSISFDAQDIKVKIKTAAFDPSKNKIDYDEGYPIRINKKTYYGGFGSMPKTYISNFTIVMGKDTVAIPPTAYADLYNLNFAYNDKGTSRTTSGIYRSVNTHRLYLYLFCKDKTGSYEVTWVIYDKKFVRRVLDYGFM